MGRRYGGSLRLLALVGALAWGLSACGSMPSDQDPSDLAAARPSGGGGGGKTTGPKVSAVDPDTVPANASLSIRVLGSGFTTGSQVAWALNGVPSTKVTTSGPVTFVSSKELRVPVTVAADAQLTSYDVVVTTSGGKKGIGVEMLLVVAELIQLPEPEGFLRSGAWDVSDGGVIVGGGVNAAGRTVALRWTPSGTTWTVEQLGEGNAKAINESGYILLSGVDLPEGGAQAVRTPSGSVMQFGSEFTLDAIGNSGTLVGTVRTSDNSSAPLAWRMSGSGWASPTPLQVPSGWSAWPNSISDRDDVSGHAFVAGDGLEWPVVWRYDGAGWGPMELVDTEFGGCGLAINARGSIGGCHWPVLVVGECSSRPAFWAAPGAPRQLLAAPLFDCAMGGAKFADMNNADQVAGQARIPLERGASEWHAVVWLTPADPAPLDLGALKPMMRTGAAAINDGNLVVGWLDGASSNGFTIRHAVAWRLP